MKRLPSVIYSDAARPVRFALTGGTAGLMQLGLLYALTNQGLNPVLANAAAFLLAAQFNFSLSQIFTWYDRWPSGSAKRMLLTRWLAFHGAIAGTAMLNMSVFVAARLALPDLLAAALGIGTAAIVNFAANDRLVFRTGPLPRSHPMSLFTRFGHVSRD